MSIAYHIAQAKMEETTQIVSSRLAKRWQFDSHQSFVKLKMQAQANHGIIVIIVATMRASFSP
jgi:hypothetical protein